MEIENFLYLLDDPNRITENDLNQLEDLVAEYPYFQIAHILIAKGTQNRKSVLAPQKVRRAATYAYDRNLLRKMIEENYNHVLKAATTQKQHTQILEPHPISEEFIEADTFEQTVEENFDLESENVALESNGLETQNNDLIPETDGISSENEFITSETEPQPDLESTLPTQVESKYSEVDDNLVSSINQGELTEGLAMDLFNDGKVNEAVYVYEELIKANPDRKDYFIGQVRVLTDDDNYDFDISSLPVPEPVIENIQPEVEESTQDEEIQVVSFSEIENPETESSVIEDIENTQENQEIENSFVAEDNETAINEEENEISTFDTKENDDTVEDTSESPETDNVTDNKQEIIEEIVPETGFEEEIIAKPIQENINIYDDSVTETLALSYYQKGEIEQAVEIYQKLLIKYPDRENYYSNRIQELQQELAKQSEEKISLTELNPDELSTETTSFFDSLDEDLEKIEEIKEDASISEKKAIQLFNEKRYQEAIAVYELLIAKDVDKADYYLKQIEVLRQEQDFHQKTSSLEENNTAVVLDNLDDEVSESKAMALYGQGRRDEAIAMYQVLINEEPDKKAYYESQLTILSEEGNSNVPDSVFSSETSTDANVLDENTAMNLFIEGKVEEAVQIYQQLITLHPDRADYFQKQIEVLKSE